MKTGIVDEPLFIGYNKSGNRGRGAFPLPQKTIPVTNTEHKIGKTTYIVCSSASESATDTLDKKIKKLIRKDMEQNAANARN